ncbi:hypothetical protein Q7P35_008401 [Cladosporium inversicolor]
MDTPLIDDDHIIELLRKDAQAGRLGSSLTTARRDKNAPKPNTRFLRNLVRDADSHNAALLAKEKAETRARLKGLENGAKRNREDAGNRDDDDTKRQRRGGEREGRWKGVLSGLGKPSLRERDGERRSERSHRSRDRTTRYPAERIDAEERTHKESRSHRRRRSRSPESRSRSPRYRKRSDRDREQRSAHRSRSHETKERRRNRSRDRRSRSPDDHHERKSTTKSRTSASHKERTPRSPPSKSTHDSPSDSDDPLNSFLGPAPPPVTRPRGRGAASSNRSTMDLRFNDPSYNPRADVDLSDSGDEGGKDDWPNSLEALRDRAAWREKGAQRLREAGFKEQDVVKWESGGRDKDERDLKWKGKGEGREWDAGKVAGDEGEVRVKAAWTKGLGL